MKFKVGDKVRIRTWGNMVDEYGTDEWGGTIPGKGGFVAVDMKKYCGRETTVVSYSEGEYTLEIDGAEWWWPEFALLPVEEQGEPVGKKPKQKYKLTQDVNSIDFLRAVERYVNAEKYPQLGVVLAILGIEKIGE